MFADIDANGWAVIISAIGIVVIQVVSRIISHLEHKTTITKVEEIHEATNSMKDALVEATKKEAFARGEQSQRDKDANKEKP